MVVGLNDLWVEQTELVSFRVEHDNVVVPLFTDTRSKALQSLCFRCSLGIREIEMDAIPACRCAVTLLKPYGGLTIRIDGDARVGFRCQSQRGEPRDLLIVIRPNVITRQSRSPEMCQRIG